MTTPPRILLGVTADISLTLMRGFPEYLRDNGWEVHVVSAPGAALSALSAIPGITTHAISMARQPSPVRDLRSLVAWCRLLRRVRPSLISVGTPKAGLLGGLAGFLTRVPHRVYLLRGLRLETSTGVQRRVLSVLERASMTVAHDVIAVSHSLRQRAIDLKLVQESKIQVLGLGSSNGVDLLAFSRDAPGLPELARSSADLGISAGVPVIGFVGRLTADKGLSVLADAREILASRGIDHHLLVVGGIDEGASETLLNKIMTAGRDAIRTGHVSDPRPYYALMDILCLPTYREGFPNVVLEAAAAEIPTVTTDATGAIDSVIDGRTGTTVAVGSAIQLANALELLISDSSLRQVMGADALRHVTAHFNQPDVWLRTHTYYLNLLTGPGIAP